MAELNTGVFADVLGVADDSLEQFANALIGDDEPDSLVIDVQGDAGTTVSVSLVVENRRPEAATISFENVPLDGFALAASPHGSARSRPIAPGLDQRGPAVDSGHQVRPRRDRDHPGPGRHD